MAIRWKYESASGESRPWTLKEIVQGKPVDRPLHTMFVHFPIAYYVAAFILDVLSHIGHHPWAPTAATWLLAGAFLATAVLVTTGLVDRSTTRPGSKPRGLANTHMWLQFGAAGVFVLDFIIRVAQHHNRPQARPLWILLDAIGVVVVLVGADFGGQLVYKIGMRVGE